MNEEAPPTRCKQTAMLVAICACPSCRLARKPRVHARSRQAVVARVTEQLHAKSKEAVTAKDDEGER